MLSSGRNKKARGMNLSLPAAPAGSWTVGVAACGDVWALPRLGGALACLWVSVVAMGGEAACSLLLYHPGFGGAAFHPSLHPVPVQLGSPLEASSSPAPLQQVRVLWIHRYR